MSVAVAAAGVFLARSEADAAAHHTEGAGLGVHERVDAARRPASRFRIVTGTGPVAAGTVIGISPVFQRYGGPVRVVVQLRQGSRWVAVGRGTLDRNRALTVRIWRPGVAVIRAVYGPGFRRATATTRIRVYRPLRERVAVGPNPREVAVFGRDLWVLEKSLDGRRDVLRLLDARNGRRRAGPVALPGLVFYTSFVTTPRGVVVQGLDGSSSIAHLLDPKAPSLIGQTARLTFNFCPPACVPPQLVIDGQTSDLISWNGRETTAALGPDGILWTLNSENPAAYQSDPPHRAVQRTERGAGPPIDRGLVGPMSGSGLQQGVVIAASGGLWVRDTRGQVRWLDADGGPAVLKGRADSLSSDGRTVWALRSAPGGSRPRLVRLDPAPGRRELQIEIGEVYTEGAFAVGASAAWVVLPVGQTLVRVPLPR